jgi:hypothetical protein
MYLKRCTHESHSLPFFFSTKTFFFLLLHIRQSAIDLLFVSTVVWNTLQTRSREGLWWSLFSPVLCLPSHFFCWVGLLSLFFLPRKVAFGLVCCRSVCYVVKTRDATLCIVAETNAARLYQRFVRPRVHYLQWRSFSFFSFSFSLGQKRGGQCRFQQPERNGTGGGPVDEATGQMAERNSRLLLFSSVLLLWPAGCVCVCVLALPGVRWTWSMCLRGRRHGTHQGRAAGRPPPSSPFLSIGMLHTTTTQHCSRCRHLSFPWYLNCPALVSLSLCV